MKVDTTKACSNCQDGCLIDRRCNGCKEALCVQCWSEHNKDKEECLSGRGLSHHED